MTYRKKKESQGGEAGISLPGKGISRQSVAGFKRVVYAHYRADMRRMPWRTTKSPYKILVSEIMLQQTQVERVMDRYRLFIRTFPGFPSLAQARLRDVLKAWQGLGYNRRAVSLKKIAEVVMKEYGGRLPSSNEELLRLPGIGRYTASALSAFVHNRPSLCLETNIRRVFIHFFFQDRENIRDEEIYPLLEKTLDRKNPREWYYALMDYGAKLRGEGRNPNRRSARYRKQTPFQGSKRQMRGRVLKILVQSPGLTQEGIMKVIPGPSDGLDALLADLVREGFLRKRGRTYCIL